MAASLQPLKTVVIAACLISLAGCTTMNPAPGKRELMVVGNDEKVGINDAGAYAFSGPGKDTVSISILRVDGDQIVNTGKSLTLPGQPASMRARTR